MQKQEVLSSDSMPDISCLEKGSLKGDLDVAGEGVYDVENTAKRDKEEHEYVTGLKLAIVICSTTVVVFLLMLDISIIVTAIPYITSHFHSLPDVGWYGSAYLLANCSLQPLTGRMYTKFNTKYTFLGFLAILELGSLLCGLATSSTMLIVGRAVAGIGASGLMNGALTIISACVPLAKMPAYLGIMISISQIGIVLGPLIGGAFTQYTTWRWCFYINLPVGGAVTVLLFLIEIPDSNIKAGVKSSISVVLKELDIIGFTLFAPAAIQLLLALQWGGTRYHWDNATIIGLFCGAFGTFCVFLAWQHRVGSGAMIPFSMVQQRPVWSGSLVMLFFMGSQLITSYYLPIYFQAVRDASPTMSGVYMLPSILSQIIFATVSGVLVGRLGYYLPWSIACGIFTPVGTGLLSSLTPSTSAAKWIGYQILLGTGRGMGIQMPIIAIQNTLPATQVPVGMSLAVFSQSFGGALFLSFAQTTFNSGLTRYVPAFAARVAPSTVIDAGAYALREAVPATALEGVLEAYNKSINHVFYLAIGSAAATFVFCWGMGWKSIKTAKKV